MKKPTLEEVKEYFKNAKKVRCLFDGKNENYHNKETNFWNKEYWCGNNLKLWDDIKGYAKIISYKEPSTKVRNSILLQLAENNSYSEEILKKEFPQLFDTPTDIISIVEKYGKDKVISLIKKM